MERGHACRADAVRLDDGSPPTRESEGRPEDRGRGGGTQQDEHLRAHEVELEVEPRPAGADLRGVGTLVEPALALGLPLEVLHDIAHERLLAPDAGIVECPTQQLAGRPDERVALDVLTVARLLAEEEQGRVARPLSEDGLGGAGEQVTGRAARGDGPRGLQARPRVGEEGRVIHPA